jgi:hypothetical protein
LNIKQEKARENDKAEETLGADMAKMMMALYSDADGDVILVLRMIA